MSRTHRHWGYTPARRCPTTGKASFRSTVAARAFVATRGEWNGDISRVYCCEHCAWYHLTSKPTRWERLRQAEAAA